MDPLDELLGESTGIVGLREQVRRLLQRQQNARQLPPILIQGETGTGKGLLADIIHRAGPRRQGPYKPVNCAAIPENLFESLMFGVERGAFTDARQTRAGLFQSAHRGTIFLDEVESLSKDHQSKLLRVVEDRTVRRLGSTRDEQVDVWIIAASNEDLAAKVSVRDFREDLYQRLTFLTLTLPPLRERGEDILSLAQHFLDRAGADHGLPPRTLDFGARQAVLAYRWPGNVRELSNVMERVAVLSEAQVVTEEMLGLRATLAVGMPRTVVRLLRHELGSLEREQLLQALNETDWNLVRAAARLGIPRNTLRYRMEKHGLQRGSAPTGPPVERRARAATPATAPASASPSAPRWEQRRLTLLRAVLVAPTSADLSLHASRALEVVAEKVQAFGGRIEERSPTGLMAVFGLDPIEDASRRAAHTAMAVQKAGERAQREGEAPGIKLAIHVGEALVGYGAGSVEIDLNAKHEAWTILESLLVRAETNTVVVSEPAILFLERRFDLVPLDPIAGVAGRAYRLTGRERPGLDVGRRMARFVGRRLNLELLHSHLASVLRGQGQIVGIAGDAGIGKSRLVAEFRESLVGQPVTYREGACLSYGSAIPYLPVLDILRQDCGIAESDTAGTIREKVRRSLEAVGMDAQESAPYLLQLLGVRDGTERLATLTPEAIKLRTLETLRRIALNASRQRPIVFVVEDLHWIDKTSEELFTALIGDLPGERIMFVSTYRPGYPPPWIAKSYASQMALQPLSPEDSLAMIRSLFPGEVYETLARLILEKAEGNPFFIEELCRTLEEHGDVGTLPSVPGTIEQVLLARIERLPAEPKRLLQTASVLGREFSARLLGAIDEGLGPVDAHLGLLSSLEFLFQRTAAKEPVYVFKHALTQQVAYASLPLARRRALHAAAGRALEAEFADRLDEAYDSLAYHYSNTEDAAKAVEYLSRFAEKAARADAHGEAIQAWEKALKHVEGLPAEVRDHRHMELALRLPSSLLPLGRVADICSFLLQERDRLERLHDSALAARYYFLLARAYMLGNHALVAENARRAIAEAEQCGDNATMSGAYGVLAVACALSGQAAHGIECGQRAVMLLEKAPDQWLLCYAYWALGLCYSQTSAFQDAVVAERQALAIAEAIGDQPLETSATWVVGIIHAVMGEWDQGIAECQRAVQRARDVLYRAIATGFLGFAYLEKGKAQPAIAALEESIPLLHQFGLRAFEGWFTTFLAESHRLEGRLDRADALAGAGLRIATEANFCVAVGWAHLALGRIAAARSDLPAAAARLDEALATFTTTHSRYECARTHMDLAAVGWAHGDGDAASRHLATARGLFQELGVPRYCERVERLAADWGISLEDGRLSS